jgi:phosphoglycolate phosphatase
MWGTGQRKMKIKGVVFDLDGTLIDSRKDILSAFSYAFEKLGKVKPDDEKLVHTIGERLEECFRSFLGDDENLLKEAALLFREYYEENYLCKTKPFEGVNELLKTLSKSHKLAITTMKKGLYARRIVEAFKWNDCFQSVIGAEEGYKPKPDKGMLLKAIDDISLKRNEVIYVGDTIVDYEMAKNAEVKFLFANWGYGSLSFDGIPKGDKPSEILLHLI